MIGNTLQGISSFEVVIRFREDLRAADQIEWKGRELNIIAPPEDRFGNRQWTTMIASTSSSAGGLMARGFRGNFKSLLKRLPDAVAEQSFVNS
jgi:hypothetical protein